MKNRLQNLKGFKKYAAAFLLGALSVLAMPPVGFFPVLLLTVPGVIWLAETCGRKRESFLTGWAFGAAYFIVGFYWISVALFVDIAQWIWVLPLSLIVGPGIFGLYYAFIPLLARRLRMNEVAHACAFIAFWSLAEYARGHLFTGFPWNLTGYAWDRLPALMQGSSLTGIYGLTLLTLFWSAAPAIWRNKTGLSAIIFSFAFFLSFGLSSMSLTPTTLTATGVRIVQANIPQGEKWDQDQEWRNFEKHTRLSAGGDPDFHPAFVIWPETSVAADMTIYPEIGRMLSLSLPDNSIGIIGTLRVTDQGQQFFNSVSVIDKNSKVVDVYNKHHLVPFGEFIPFRQYLGGSPIAAAVSGIGEFTPGNGAETFKIGARPSFSPLICYEVIFPSKTVDEKNRPDWLVNVTNDAWYGNSAGPYQHLSIARSRAIEEGLPLARAANTGISAMIDPLGRITQELEIGHTGTVDAYLPQKLAPTVFSRLGDSLFFGMILLLFFPALRSFKARI